MEHILQVLTAAVEEGKLEQSQFDEFKTGLETKKFTQEDLNKHIADRVTREENKYKPLQDELTALKEKLGDKSVDDVLSELTAKESALQELVNFKQEVENKSKESEYNQKIDSLLGNVKLPAAYRNLIEKSEDEEALKTNVENVLNQFKTDLKESGLAPQLGGGTNPSGGTGEIDYSDADALLYAGIKESRI